MKYIDYRERREQGTFRFPIAFYHITPNFPRYDMPYHWHTHYEIIRIIRGSLHLVLDDVTHTFYAGDIVFIAGGVIHGGTPRDCVYECVVFNMEFFLRKSGIGAKEADEILHKKIIINTCISEGNNTVAPIIEGLCETLSSRKTGYEFTTQGYLFLLVGEILKEKLYIENREPITDSDHLRAIKDVLTFISENYSSSISLNQLAKIAGMNPKYFCRYFKSMTERTPMDYINYFRVESAGEMLSTQKISVKEAAIRCGFNDESYFIRIFHKYKGVTPKQYTTTKFHTEEVAKSSTI